MKTSVVCLTAMVLLLGVVHEVRAQRVATPPPATVPAATSAVPAAVAPAKAGGLGGCIGSLCSKLGGCKRRCCTTPFGQLVNNMVKPLSFMTGGIIPQPCPSPTAPGGPGADPATAPGGPNGAAATAEKIKKEEAQAKARCAATRYLGTVPCHYYPEAEASLIASLRTDRSECVRWEAARALANGCCCTKKTVQALTITVSGSNKDGNPAEVSTRVKVAACEALSMCLSRICGPDLDSEPPRPEVPPEPESIPKPPANPLRPELPPDAQTGRTTIGSGVRLVAHYDKVKNEPIANVISEARRVLAQSRQPRARRVEPGTGKRNLYDLWQNAKHEPEVDVGPPTLADRESPPHPQPVGHSLERLPEIPADGRGRDLGTTVLPARESPYPLATGTRSPSWPSEPPVGEIARRRDPIPRNGGSFQRQDYPRSFAAESSPWESGDRLVGAGYGPGPARFEYPPANQPAGIRDGAPRTNVPPYGSPSPYTPQTAPSSLADQFYPEFIGNPSMIDRRPEPRTALRDDSWSQDTRTYAPRR